METSMLNQFMNSFPDFFLGHLGVDLSATDGLVEGRDCARAGRSHNLGGWGGKTSEAKEIPGQAGDLFWSSRG